MSEPYVIENEQIKKQLKYAESLTNRTFSDWDRQIFEWAYTQGYEDCREGK